MGINPRPGILPPGRMMRTFTRAMEGIGLKTPPAQFTSYCDLDEAPALSLPVVTTWAIPLGLLCIDEKERLPNTQSAQPAPMVHTGLFFSLVPMTDNRDVTLNDLQTTLLDINQHMLWLYDIMNRGVKEGSATVEEVKLMASQMGNHDSIIEDNHKDIHELMGTVDNIKEDVQKLVNIN